ncbi:MAG: hypothetical protein CHACPFDD_01942 [Phycisphaerae bacterium]|nr:hypothetical protein [Phycisphaerae bacterium]
MAAPGTLSSTVDWDAPCGRCGYNLRGLELRGRCPECGAPTWLSVGDDSLASADEAWLRRLQAGAATCNAALLVSVVLLITVSTLESRVLRVLAAAAGAAAYAAGLWLLTAPNPAAFGHERRASYRRIARAMLLLAAPSSALSVAGLLGAPCGAALLAGGILLSPLGLAGALGVMAWLHVASELARRGGHAALESRALLIGSGYFFSWIASAVFALLARVLMPAGALLFVTGATAVAFGLAALWLPFPLARVLREARLERNRTERPHIIEDDRAAPGA